VIGTLPVIGKVVTDQKLPVIGTLPVIGKVVTDQKLPVIGTLPVIGEVVKDQKLPVIGTLPVIGEVVKDHSPSSAGSSPKECGAGKVANDLRLPVNGTLPVSGNLNDQTFGIKGIFEDMFSEEDVKDILGFDAIRPDGAPWVYSSNGRRIVEVTMDSGAAATVVPRGTSIAKLGPVTKANCTNFRVANGSRIPNLGEQFIKGATSSGREIKFRAQVAYVTKPLASQAKWWSQAAQWFSGKGHIFAVTRQGKRLR